MVNMHLSPDQQFVLKNKSALLNSKNLENGSDSDSDEDENHRRKYINLQSGHGMLWSPDYSTHLDLSKSVVQDQKYYKDLVFARSNAIFPNLNSNLSRITSHGAFDLDSIQLNNDFEYGFNPNRLSGSKANVTVKLRPLSLYSPQPEKQILAHSSSDAKEKYTTLPTVAKSHASNDYEINLEKELASIRSQPCNLTFQGCEGKIVENEFAEDLASSRRRRKIRRQLSFDSHPSRKWQKTLSLDSGLATDGSFKSDRRHSMKDQDKVKDVELDIDDSTGNGYSYSAECLLNDEKTLVSSPEDETDAEKPLNAPLPKYIEEKPIQEEVLVRGTSYEVNKPAEKQKRRGSIPHILSAFRLPNKKLKKLIRKKPQEANLPMKVSHDINPKVTLVETKSIDIDYIEKSDLKNTVKVPMGTDNFSFLDTVNSIEQSEKKSINGVFDKSLSAQSLPKVDEECESLEFRNTIERRSQSSCNITSPEKQQNSAQLSNGSHRRMSDTIISVHDKHHPGTSPCKRFVRKLLSPVVCGLPSPDRHSALHGSYTSLGSYDSGSIISENEDSYPHLFDFGSHELMEEMTRIDKELLIRIPWGELSILGWMSPDKYVLAPNIMKMVQFFNRVVMLVTTSILSEETPYRRAKIIQKAIKLAVKLRYKKNFNSLKAVLGGLQCTPIFRLKATWKQVPSRYRRVFRELSELMSEENNFSKYRLEMNTSLQSPPCIPFLGNFLTTVAHVHAFVAVRLKYKEKSQRENNENSDDNEDDDGDSSYTLSPPFSPPAIQEPKIEKREGINKQIDPCLQSSSEKVATACHMRTDSDDSGVVLNVNRLSRSSEDLEPSPRETLNSPDDTKYKFEEVFNKNSTLNNSNQLDCSCPEPCKKHKSTSLRGKQRYSEGDVPAPVHNLAPYSHPEPLLSPVRHRRSVSVDNADLVLKRVADIASLINSRPVKRNERDDDELYECEFQFWKYQIAAVQYNILPRTYIRRYLMNSPYNTEEDSYKLSLTRESPASLR